MSSELWDKVVFRDAYEIWRLTQPSVPFSVWRNLVPLICVPAFVGRLRSGSCSGRQTVDHVKDQMMVGDPIVKRKTIRAQSDEWHLVAACHYHNAVVPPSHDTRYEERAWLRRLRGGIA